MKTQSKEYTERVGMVKQLNQHPEKMDDIELADVKGYDYPDFCDAYIESASFNGQEVPTEVLEQLDSDEVQMMVNKLATEQFVGA
jgi:hypothetical protein